MKKLLFLVSFYPCLLLAGARMQMTPAPGSGSPLYPSTSTILPVSIRLGPVTVIHSSGTYDIFTPTGTDAGAYGAALVRSQSSWTDNMAILLGPGTFDMGGNYLTLYTSTRSALIGSGKNLTRLKLDGAGWGIQPSSFCYISDLTSGGAGAGLGGLTEVTGTHLVLNNVDIEGSQDAIAINYNYDNIDIVNSVFRTTFDAMVFTNTNSSATINIYNSKFISKEGGANASGINCYGTGIVNSWNNYVEVKDAGTRLGYANGGGLGSCKFNIYGGSVETYNGGTDIITYGGSANVTNDFVYISSKTSGTINFLNQNSTQALRSIRFADGTTQTTASVGTDTSQVYGTTTTPNHPYGIAISSDGSNVTFNVNTSGISGFAGPGASFSITTDDGSSISAQGALASMYANQNVSITGESNAHVYGMNGVNVSANNTPIVLNPNYSGGLGGSVTVKDLLTVNDANSNVEVYLGTLPVNSGFGPQVVTDGIWNKTNNSGSTLGSFNIVVATTSKMITGGGAPVIPAPGANLSFTASGISFSTYNYDNRLGSNQWSYDSSGLSVQSPQNVGVSDFNILQFGQDQDFFYNGTPFRFSWSNPSTGSNWLQFDDGGGNIQTLRANINSDSVSDTSLSTDRIVYSNSGTLATDTDLYWNSSTNQLGIGTGTPSGKIGFNGNQPGSIMVGTTTNTNGNILEIRAGAAAAGGTNRNGGDLILKSGAATGSGSSSIRFYTVSNGTGMVSTSFSTETEKASIRPNGGFWFGSGAGTGFINSSINAGIDISYGGSPAGLVLGAENNLTTRTSGTVKNGRIGIAPYSSSQMLVSCLIGNTGSSSNVLAWGGGTSIAQAATQQDFYTGPYNTVSPPARLSINSIGNVYVTTGTFIVGTNTYGLVASSMGYTSSRGPFTVAGGSTTLTGLVAQSSTTFTGGMTLFSRTLAQLNSMAPANVGISYYCTTCVQEAVCISTGTGTGAFSSVSDKTNACN